MSPAEQLLAINTSFIYPIINYSFKRKNLDDCNTLFGFCHNHTPFFQTSILMVTVWWWTTPTIDDSSPSGTRTLVLQLDQRSASGQKKGDCWTLQTHFQWRRLQIRGVFTEGKRFLLIIQNCNGHSYSVLTPCPCFFYLFKSYFEIFWSKWSKYFKVRLQQNNYLSGE